MEAIFTVEYSTIINSVQKAFQNKSYKEAVF